MRPLRAVALLALASLFSLGCSQDPPPKVEPEPEQAPAPAAPAAEVEPTPDEVPIAEDFEAQATAEVKPENLSGQLDAIEKEIELDAP